MSLVLDASITLAWCFAEERTEAATAVLRRVSVEGAVVPTLWRLEVGNVLQLAARRGRISRANRDASIDDLRALDIEVDDETDSRAWSEALRLAEHTGLTLYDAAYLELAQRQGLPLATADAELAAAAVTVGVALV